MKTLDSATPEGNDAGLSVFIVLARLCGLCAVLAPAGLALVSIWAFFAEASPRRWLAVGLLLIALLGIAFQLKGK